MRRCNADHMTPRFGGAMNDSILKSIKKLLGLDEDYTAFDEDVMIHLNSALFALEQIGVGNPLTVTGSVEVWGDLGVSIQQYQGAKTYVYLKTRLLFDPPASATIVEAFTSQLDQLEWRLNVKSEGET